MDLAAARSPYEQLCTHVSALVELLGKEQMPSPWAKTAMCRVAASARQSRDEQAGKAWGHRAAMCARMASGEASAEYRAICAEFDLRD